MNKCLKNSSWIDFEIRNINTQNKFHELDYLFFYIFNFSVSPCSRGASNNDFRFMIEVQKLSVADSL